MSFRLLFALPLLALVGCAPEVPVASHAESLRLETHVECPWVGRDVVPPGGPALRFANPATRQPGLELVGTDLAFGFFHGGYDYVLFGDTTRVRSTLPGADDSFARLMDRSACPTLDFLSEPGSASGRYAPAALHAWASTPSGYVELPMGTNHTPVGGFSDGTSAWAMMIGERPCTSAASCGPGDVCTWVPGVGNACAAGGAGGGYPRSVIGFGRFLYPPHSYNHTVVEGWLSAREWQTTAARTVPRFDPAAPFAMINHGAPNVPDGAPATRPALFVWGRPAFASGVQQPTYLAYYELSGAQRWDPWYFTGTSSTGVPTWRRGTQDATTFPAAVPVIAASTEWIDGTPILANGQMSVSWIPGLGRWMMIYGGRPVTTDPTTAFADDARYGVYFRLSMYPWGPWSLPVRLWDARRGNAYGYGGFMYHPQTNPAMQTPGEWPVGAAGGEYGVGILDRLTTTDATGTTSIHWALSTWHPYRVVMMTSTFSP